MTEREPASASRRARRRAQRIEEMLDAAMDIALRDGPEKLTIAKLAARIDAAVGALYRYFPSKDALVAAMQHRAVDQLRSDLQAVFADVDRRLCQQPPAIAALAGAVAIAPAYLAQADLRPRRHRLIDAWVSSPSPLLSDTDARAVNETLAPILALVVNRLQRATDAGALRSGDQLARAHVLWALVHGLSHFRKRDRIQPQALQVAALLTSGLQALLVGWGAPSQEAARAVAALVQAVPPRPVE